MKLPERLQVRLLADGTPVKGMFVRVTIKTTRKNDFVLGFGPSDEEGMLQISRAQLLREAEKERRLFVMDYGHPEADFAGEISVRALSREDLQRAIVAYDLYQGVSPYAPEYAENLQEARLALEELKPRELAVEVVCYDPRIRARAEATSA